MFEIIEREVLAENIYRQRIKTPRIAKYAKPGQFVIVRIDEKGERIPLTIADFDREKQTVDIVFMAIGKTTKQLAALGAGDSITDIVGPLGKPSDIEDIEKIVFVGGGIGVAPVYPQARAYKEAGVHVISIIGARSADILIWEDKMDAVSDELYITTDDGTKGHHGFVTQVLEKLLTEDSAIQRVVAIGPAIMMKMVAQV
ncbi:MAG: sulfide/dihydroorotate dehydrogenase-like FAD/NAD-binding protein, partial [Methanosarcinales archaeon]|nr:sulfide/dihydroorotate dehydrogenase-like FAD/NAD-binding protein [Methanosarcinales archaeon]